MLIEASKIAWLCGAVGWYFIRLPHQRRSGKTPISVSARTRNEIVALVLSGSGLGLVPALYVFTPWLSFANHDHNWFLFALGIVLFGAALVLFRLTHKALGRNWSVSLDLREKHELITEGIYKSIRHPMYSAFWLWAIAQAFLLPNWIAGLSGLVCFGILYFQRIGNEERLMEQEFGQSYRDYSKRTGRIFPKL